MVAKANQKHAAAPRKAFPAEAYNFDAPITVDAVNILRERVKQEVESEDWVVIDGIGAITAS